MHFLVACIHKVQIIYIHANREIKLEGIERADKRVEEREGEREGKIEGEKEERERERERKSVCVCERE